MITWKDNKCHYMFIAVATASAMFSCSCGCLGTNGFSPLFPALLGGVSAPYSMLKKFTLPSSQRNLLSVEGSHFCGHSSPKEAYLIYLSARL